VDVQGAATLRRLLPDALLIFIAPPSLDEARRRLELRGTDDPDDVQRRVEAAEAEMEAARDFDFVVVNETGRLEDTALRVAAIIAAEKSKRAGKTQAAT
jgi:guanylate kinase